MNLKKVFLISLIFQSFSNYAAESDIEYESELSMPDIDAEEEVKQETTKNTHCPATCKCNPCKCTNCDCK